MFLHTLKISLRNLSKYKLQTLVSVAALAVGIVTLAATHFVMKHYGAPAVSKEEYYDRCYVADFPESCYLQPVDKEVGTKDQQTETLLNVLVRTVPVSDEMHDALFSCGPLPGVERVIHNAFMGGITMGSGMTFTLPDGSKREGAYTYYIKQADDLNFWGIRSALTGEKIPVLRNKEIVISERHARDIFGKENPVGCTVNFYFNGTEFVEFTIRDVYAVGNITDDVSNEFFVYVEGVKDDFHRSYVLVLEEGQDPKEVEAEMVRRLKHFDGSTARLTSMKESFDNQVKQIAIVCTIVYLISSLILAAALIGFLKMQLQLFRMRQREVALRRVHGATRQSIFRLFACETLLTFLLAGMASFILAALLIEFTNTTLMPYLNDWGWQVEGVYESVAVILCAVVLLSLFVVWLTVRAMVRQRQSMAAQLHRSRGHALRNTMLGIQIAICLLFVGGSIALTHFSELTLKSYNIPDNDDFYKECILVRPYSTAEDSPKILEYLRTEAKDIEKFIPVSLEHYRFREVQDNPEATEEFGYLWFGCYKISDTTYLDFWNRPIHWILPPEDRTDCILLSDSLYAKFERYGLTANGVIHSIGGTAKRIGGTFATLPYKDLNRPYSTFQTVELGSLIDPLVLEIIVHPKEGAYDRVFADLTETMHRINPKSVEPTVKNLRKTLESDIVIMEVMQRGAWILSSICLVICLMGIWSTIALDTRSRQKEVALRKVHGAKRKDIILLFGRLYLWLIAVATIVSAPLIIIFTTLLKQWANSSVSSSVANQLSPVLPILASLALTVLIIILIVGHHIHGVMKVKPAEIIAKE